MATHDRGPKARKPRKPLGSRGGPPHTLDQQIATETGTTTIGQRILDLIGAGNFIEPAAMAAGITRGTVLRWLRDGAICETQQARMLALGVPTTSAKHYNPTPYDLRCLKFRNDFLVAEAAWEVGSNVTLEILGRGGYQTTKVTTKTVMVKDEVTGKMKEEVVERTTTVEQLAPNERVLMGRLARRHPGRYQERIAVDSATTPGREAADQVGGPVAAVESLSATIRQAMQAKIDEAFMEGAAAASETKTVKPAKPKETT